MTRIHLHQNDLPRDLALAGDIAVDTETTGLVHHRDRLCLIQIADRSGHCHLVKLSRPPAGLAEPAATETSPRLCAVLADPARTKIMHFARFDLAAIYNRFAVMAAPVFCTRTASRLCRTYTDRHGLKELVREMLGADIAQTAQTSDWGADNLSNQQRDYAANDVLFLHALKEKLTTLLHREERFALAEECFRFLPARARLDLAGWHDQDIFSHNTHTRY